MIDTDNIESAEVRALEARVAREVAPSLTGNADLLYSSFPASDSPLDRAAQYNAISGECKSLADCVNTTINVVNVLAHKVALTDAESGEIIDLVRIVVVDDKGEAYQCVSAGVLGSFQRLFGVFGQPPYSPPLPVIIKSVKTRRGFKTLSLLIDTEALIAAASALKAKK